MEWHTATPIRWGAAAVKYGLFPSSSVAPAKPPEEDAADRLSQDLRQRLAAGPVVFELRVQPYIDAERTPIEDPRVLWEDAVSPWLPVARLTFPQQSLDDEAGRRRRDAVEGMSFDPWHAPGGVSALGRDQPRPGRGLPGERDRPGRLSGAHGLALNVRGLRPPRRERRPAPAHGGA
ncbi:MAG: hypothetical protein IPN01_22155 [Deltaproteobacteria bacterium]|nr:hypothetical protein [Deltaproteobacteria bacterium]